MEKMRILATLAAAIAFATCLAGAILFLFYGEKKILTRIDELKAES